MAKEENPFDHILYEFSMYISTMFLNTHDHMQINLHIDSHLVHLRNLAYFFDKKRNCDIHASEYIMHPEECLLETTKLNDIYHITNCAACHMSKERLKPDFKEKTRKVEKDAFKLLLPMITRYMALLETDIKPIYEASWKNESIQESGQRILRMIAQIVGFEEGTAVSVTTE